LLADFARDEEAIMFKLFKRYSGQLYMWLESGKQPVSGAAERSLANLWQQRVPDHVLPIMKKIEMPGLNSKNFLWEFSNGKRGTAHELIMIQEYDSLSVIGDEFRSGFFGEDVFQIFLHYIYRKPITISRAILDKAIQFSKKLQNIKLEWFLMRHHKPKEQQGNSPETPQQKDPNNKEVENQEKEQKKQSKQITLNFQKIPKDLSKFINDKQFSDVFFHFPTENKEILGNRLILSANCPYFSRMLNNGLRESKESQIVINNMSYDICYQIMVYCYGGKVQFTPENCVELLQIADEFDLPKLKILCELFIGQRLDTDNMDDIEQIATIYNAPRLKKHCEHKKKVKDNNPSVNLEQTYEMPIDKN